MIEYSIAVAKNRLPTLVHEVESEGAVQLTRRGRPVAVILSGFEYERLLRGAVPMGSLTETIAQWRQEVKGALPELTEDEVDGWRDRSPGRDFRWPE